MHTRASRSRLAPKVLVCGLLVSGASLTACSNGGEGFLSGAALGSLAGMAIGSTTGNMGEGAAIGAVVGGLGGLVIGDQNERADKRANHQSNAW